MGIVKTINGLKSGRRYTISKEKTLLSCARVAMVGTTLPIGKKNAYGMQIKILTSPHVTTGIHSTQKIRDFGEIGDNVKLAVLEETRNGGSELKPPY